MIDEKFWLEEPRDLFARLNLLPSSTDTLEEKLNTISRLLIVASIILCILKWKHWYVLLITGIFLIIFVYLLKSEKSVVEHFDEDMTDLTYYKDVPVMPINVTSSIDEIVAVTSSIDQEDDIMAKLYYTCEYAPLETLYTRYVSNGVIIQIVESVPVKMVKTLSKTIKKKKKVSKTAYEEMRASYDYMKPSDTTEKDRKNLIGALF